MSANNAIARVICRILREKVANVHDSVKLVVQGIPLECVKEAVSLMQKDPVLKDQVEIHLSRKSFAALGLPDQFLTDDAVGSYRNEEPEPGKKIMLLGPPDESEWNTVQLMQPFGEQEIMEADSAWVQEFIPDVVNIPERIQWWRAALRALNSLAFAKLNEFANYVEQTAAQVALNGQLPEALGRCLPALRLPRRTDLFSSISDKLRAQTSAWKKKLNDHKRSTQCFLFKKDRSEALIDNEILASAVKEYAIQPDHDPKVAAVFEEYVTADYGWTSTSLKMAELEWNVVNPALFERVKTTKKQNLGADTLALFESEQKVRDLADPEKEYLEQLAQAGDKGEATNQDKAFFRRYYRELQNSPSLFSRWEGFILERSVEDTDFFNGLARCIKVLRPRVDGKEWKLIVRARSAKDKDLYHINEAAGTYFSTRYQGIQAILTDSVEFKNLNGILRFPLQLAEWKKDPQIRKKLKVNSASREACQLVFYVELSTDSSRQIKLIWKFNPKSVASNLRDDMVRLADAKHPAVATKVVRETSGRRAVPLNLEDMRCLQPVYSRSVGSLIPPTDKLKGYSVRNTVSEVLDDLVQTKNLTDDQSKTFLAAFDAFELTYSSALKAFLEKGVASSEEVASSAKAYDELLSLASANELPDTVLGALLPVLLSISTVRVESFGAQTRPTAIVGPWHPLRLLAITSKATQFAALAKRLTSGTGTLSDAEGDLLFEDTAEWLGHIYYPEVVCQLRGKQPDILSDCEHYREYSVHEPPVRTTDFDAPSDTDPKAAAAQVGKVVGEYLDLQPHERDNLSVVLFNCDSELLPQAVVEEIKDLSEDEEQDAMCQVLLAHSDKPKLRALFRSLTKASETSDSFNTSEATREFMARLRINIMVSDAASSRPQDAQPYDIVFAEGTIARQARLDWEEIQIDHRPAESVKPSSWSRRKPMRSGAITSSVYLTSPVGPTAIWSYLKAIACAKEPEKARKVAQGMCLVPCRSLAINDESIGQVIEKMHTFGTWVVNFDELLHRKLLQTKGIKIIRYKQDATQGRNLIISSKAKESMLRNALRQLIAKLLPDLDQVALAKLIDDLINEANTISGNLVLRAVRRIENAKELLGLVLSKFLITSELGGNRNHGWFLLDDYAAWLGEDEQQIADILCLSPGFDTAGKPILDVVVTEAKFVEHGLVNEKARESATQLRQTLARLERGLCAEGDPLDRSIWLARISDMIVDGIESTAIDNFNAAEWRRMVRDGECGIRIRGYSHVFDHGPEQAPSVDPAVPIKETKHGFQEVFPLSKTREFLKTFCGKQTPSRDIPGSHASQGYQTAPQQSSAPFADDSELPPEASANTVVVAPTASAPGSQLTAVVLPVSDTNTPELASSPQTLSAILSSYSEPQAADKATLDWMSKTALDMRKAVASYNMPAELIGQPVLTPNSLLLRFRGSDALTLSSIEKKRSQFYTTHGLKIVNVREEPGALAISVERSPRQVIRLGSVWKHWNPSPSVEGNTKLLIAVKEADSSPLFLDPLTQSPHTLIAGTSGSGKSVLLQNILLAIAATNSPSLSQIVLIDPKHGVDYGRLGDLPHIQGGIITNVEDALVAIEELVQEMERRYPLLNEAGVNHVRLYNKQRPEKLPYIWLIHDEFADWMQDENYRESVVSLVNRLGMKARAAGIFLIFAAQRPSVEVMPMQLRDNLDNRLILRVAQEGTSQFCLGEKGAENLLPQGQMLARLGGNQSALAQVPFADLAEIQTFVEALTAAHNATN